MHVVKDLDCAGALSSPRYSLNLGSQPCGPADASANINAPT